MSGVALPPTPYKGIVPYSEADAPFFFGRESDEAHACCSSTSFS